MKLDNARHNNYIVIINDICYVWDTAKNISNLTKHNVSFEEAVTVFSDNQYIEKADPDHSETEERLIVMGISEQYRLLVVCNTVSQDEKTVRIISAREATLKEEKQYGGKTNARRI